MWMLGVVVLCLALPEAGGIESGQVDVEGGRIFYEAAGQGPAYACRHRGPKSVAIGRLAEIKDPVLIVVGERDIPDVHAHTGVIEAGIAGSRRVVLPRSGHLVALEAFSQVVLEYLRGIKP